MFSAGFLEKSVNCTVIWKENFPTIHTSCFLRYSQHKKPYIILRWRFRKNTSQVQATTDREVLSLKPLEDRDIDKKHFTDFLNDILLHLQSFPKSSTSRKLFSNQRLTVLLWTASQSQRTWILLRTIQSELSVRLSTLWCMVWFWREIHRGWKSAQGVMLRTIHEKFFKESPIISSHLRCQCHIWIEFLVRSRPVLKVFLRVHQYSSLQKNLTSPNSYSIKLEDPLTLMRLSLKILQVNLLIFLYKNGPVLVGKYSSSFSVCFQGKGRGGGGGWKWSTLTRDWSVTSTYSLACFC